ncbi:Leo1-domain-containing protein [Wolfiporia cocos MD-104 SS10]|uniref:Leo1-domain-containing protein n=1 Tax=Wolfiporia cocos (strain MD-104) TaxID=742152 RepID=A0A2H3J5S4_WOLCO|nr:Leo1-domain-containing protein [Wolfiporia cocos MD-104 SS10]
MQDLFGDENENEVNVVKHEDVHTPASSEHAEHADGLSSPERKHREAMEYAEEEDAAPVEEQVLEANAAIPNIPVPRSSDGNYWVIRMPNFVKVDSKPFHPDTYIGPEQEDEELQQAENIREKSMSIKLKVENTVRWRWVKDEHGQDKRQSNSRIVRWSDGTLSLQLGKELFDITQTIDRSGAVPRQAFGPSSSQTPTPTPSAPAKSQGLTYLVAQHKRAEILQCEALITGHMSLRPTGMQSETHRMLVRAVGQKHTKVARLRMAPDPTTDPEREKMEMMRQAARKPRRPRAEDDALGGGRRRRSAGYTRRRTGDDMWSDDEEEDAVFGGGSEDEYGEEGAGTSAGGRGGKRRKTEESSKKGPGEYQTDDFLVADTDEEDADYGSDDGGSKRKRARKQEEEEDDDDDDDDDDLEKLEAQIDKREAEERRRRKDSGGAGRPEKDEDEEGEAGMDFESEEEEDDDFNVRRRTTSGARKRRAIGIDEEEE